MEVWNHGRSRPISEWSIVVLGDEAYTSGVNKLP